MKVVIEKSSNFRINKLPDLGKQLRLSGKEYIQNYKQRLESGFGVMNSNEYSLFSKPNPPWIQRLKGSSQPLKHTGGMSKAVRINEGLSDNKTVTIDFAQNTTKGGVDGSKTDSYARVAARMQKGGISRNVSMYFNYKGKPLEINVSRINITARPHFFTTTEDRDRMVRPIFDKLQNWIREGLVD